MSKPNDRRWRIGDLAEAARVTVRTLRHYEQEGLLTPAVRNEGNQRVYDVDDVRRLYRICALRDLGLSLPEVRRVLADGGAPLVDVLRDHLASVESELQRLARLRELLGGAYAQAETGKDPDVLATIEAMARVARRLPATAQPPGSSESHWRELGNKFRTAMETGDPPSAPHVVQLARAAKARILAFGGGDAAVVAALAHLRKVAPPQNLAGWNPPLVDYLDQALAHLASLEQEV